MNMAETVALVGLISAIVQLVDTGTKITSRLHEFASATNDVPESFRDLRTQLPIVIHTLQRVRRQADAGLIDDVAATALKSLVNNCVDQTLALLATLDKVFIKKGLSSYEKRLLALKSLFYDKNVQRNVRKLQENILVLTLSQTTILQDAIEIIGKGVLRQTCIPSTNNPENYGLWQELPRSFEEPG